MLRLLIATAMLITTTDAATAAECVVSSPDGLSHRKAQKMLLWERASALDISDRPYEQLAYLV